MADARLLRQTRPNLSASDRTSAIKLRPCPAAPRGRNPRSRFDRPTEYASMALQSGIDSRAQIRFPRICAERENHQRCPSEKCRTSQRCAARELEFDRGAGSRPAHVQYSPGPSWSSQSSTYVGKPSPCKAGCARNGSTLVCARVSPRPVRACRLLRATVSGARPLSTICNPQPSVDASRSAPLLIKPTVIQIARRHPGSNALQALGLFGRGQ